MSDEKVIRGEEILTPEQVSNYDEILAEINKLTSLEVVEATRLQRLLHDPDAEEVQIKNPKIKKFLDRLNSMKGEDCKDLAKHAINVGFIDEMCYDGVSNAGAAGADVGERLYNLVITEIQDKIKFIKFMKEKKQKSLKEAKVIYEKIAEEPLVFEENIKDDDERLEGLTQELQAIKCVFVLQAV